MPARPRFLLIPTIFLFLWTPALAQEAGILHFLAGDVRVDGKKAALGMKIPRGATVETGEASIAEVRYGRETGLRIREKSRVRIDRPGAAYRILLAHGALLSIVKHRADFEVQTPVTTAGVRGTFFFVQVPDDTTAYICVCNGRVELRDGEKVLRRVSAAHHEACGLRGRPGGVALAPAGMVNHTDTEIFEQRFRLEE